MLAARDHRFPPNLLSAKLHFRPAATTDAAALSTFLQQVFRLPSDTMLFDERHIAWKYWSERPDWSGSRSFTARHDDTIVAHVAAWPVRLRLPDRVVSAVHLIDWASDPKYPGAGIWLLRQVAKVRLLIATGGTEITRRTLPVLGFRPFGDVCGFARPLRPFGQALTTDGNAWRLPGRFVRNSVWRFSPPISAPDGWSAAPIAPDDIAESVWPQGSPSVAVGVRDAALYRYILASPSTRHALFALTRKGEQAGYFCIAYARHVARIADLWVTSTAVDDWCAGFRTAAAVAAREKDMYEVSAWASTALGKAALPRAGFRLRDCSMLSHFGDAGPLHGRELHIQMLDSDASFLAADEVSYLT
jgi:hypothetical protein